MALTTVSSDRLSTNVKNTNFTAAEKQDLTDDILPLAGQLGNKNLIINGGCAIDQRNSGSSVTGGSDVYAIDRTQIENFDGGGTGTGQRVTDSPSGFYYSLKITVTGTDTSLAANDYYSLRQIIEGNNIAHLGFGASGGTSVTLSFYVKSSVTGTFCSSIGNGSNNRVMPKEYTISAANTWERKTLTFPADTTGTWGTDNGRGIIVRWSLGAGSNRTGTADTYNASEAHCTSNQTNLFATNAATFQITGMQLEAGSVATDFEHRPFAVEERLCQRYYSRQSAEHQHMRYACHGQTPSANGAQYVYPLPVRMRAVPTLGYSALGDFYMYAGNLQSKTPTSLAMDAQSTISPMFSGAKSGTFTGGQMAHLTTPNTNQGYLEFIAEL